VSRAVEQKGLSLAHEVGVAQLRPSPQAKAEEILCVTAIAKDRGSELRRTSILSNLSLSVRRGEFVSLVGPSGCGKTTLLLCLAGLLPTNSGTINFNGQVVRNTLPGIGVVFQDYGRSLFPWKTNLDNVIFGMRRVETKSRKEKIQTAMQMLSDVGLRGFERHYPWQVSGGMQQRVAIARALAAESKLLLLDEPMAAIDAQTRNEMQDLILQLRTRFSQTVLLVTHDIEESIYMADRVCVLSSRPASIVTEIDVSLPYPRDQLRTREDARFLTMRHKILELIRSQRQRNNTGGIE